MKKFLVVLLSVVLALSLVSCGADNKPANDETTNKPVSENTDSGMITTQLFTLEYDESQWYYDEEDTSDYEDYCQATLFIPDPEDEEYYLICAEITVEIEDPADFREDLVHYGFDQYEYEVNKKYELTEIGGVELLRYEKESSSGPTIIYFNRIESAGANVKIDIDTVDGSDQRIKELLNGLTVKLEDVGNVDGPWEWEGEKFSSDGAVLAVGNTQIASTWIPFNEYISTFETFEHCVAVVDNNVYILSEGILKQYSFNGSSLTFQKDIALPEDNYDYMNSTDDGSLWLSGSMNDLIKVKDGNIVATYKGLDTVALHPSGNWGISYFSSSECEKVTFNGDTYESEPVHFIEADIIMHLNIDEDYIYVCGPDKDDDEHRVFVYNSDCVLEKTLCNADYEGLGSITFMAQTAKGFIGFDGNLRNIMLWNETGTDVAEFDDDELFGTNYPWFCHSAVMSDGRILTIMTDEREDESATELIAFVVTVS